MKRFFEILVVLILILLTEQLWSQNNPVIPVNVATSTHNKLLLHQRFSGVFKMVEASGSLPLKLKNGVQKPLSSNYYTLHFGLFCRKELQFENATRIPLRFRLGSYEYCDYLEGIGKYRFIKENHAGIRF